jgi:hypothetical protein
VPADDVAAVLAWARRGPIEARVDELAVADENVPGAEPPFELRR